LTQLEGFVDRVEIQVLLSGENDQLNAIVNIHPGAGGTESQDWAEMLMRMYLRWAEQNGFKTQMLDYQDGEQAGIRIIRLWLSRLRDWGPSSGSHLSVRCGQAPSYVIRFCGGLSRN
jgi:peptide chain release factor 2